MATLHDLSPGFRLRGRILGLLRARPMTTPELASRLDYPMGTLQTALGILANSGHIVRRNARWELMDVAAMDGPPAA